MPSDETAILPIVLSGDFRAVPHLDQWFGPWAIEESRFRSGMLAVARMDLPAHLFAARRDDGGPAGMEPYRVERGVAIVPIQGTMMKHVASMDDGTSTVLARRQIRAAAADKEVAAILLYIDSPGGTVAGTQDLAAEVARARQSKPVHAYIEDLGTSAAYWTASQAERIAANATALVGSIGTYGVVHDLSRYAANEGIAVHVLRAGQFKGAGTPGAPVTEEQLAEWQRIIDDLNAHFLAGVAAGRAMTPERVRELADGRVHLAADAKRLGLIDTVSTFDEALVKLSKTTTNRSARAMSEPITTAAVPATYQEMKSALPGADAAFLCGQLDAQATLDQARGAWMAELSRRNADAEARARAAEEKAAAPPKPGVAPLAASEPAGTGGGGDPIAEWNDAVEAAISARRDGNRAAAVRSVVAKNPELHQAMLAAANAGRRTRR